MNSVQDDNDAHLVVLRAIIDAFDAAPTIDAAAIAARQQAVLGDERAVPRNGDVAKAIAIRPDAGRTAAKRRKKPRVMSRLALIRLLAANAEALWQAKAALEQGTASRTRSITKKDSAAVARALNTPRTTKTPRGR